MPVYNEQLGRKLVQEIGKEESEPKPEGDNGTNTCDFWKTLPSIPCMVPETPHFYAAPNIYPKTRVVPSSTSKSTERMRPPAFPTAEISVMVLHFSILLPNYDARGYDFCFYLNLLFRSSLNHKKRTTLTPKKIPPASLQNTIYSGQRLKIQVNQVSYVTIILHSETGLMFRLDNYMPRLHQIFFVFSRRLRVGQNRPAKTESKAT